MADPAAIEHSAYKRALYRRNPDYRLRMINRRRRDRGVPEAASLDECALRV